MLTQARVSASHEGGVADTKPFVLAERVGFEPTKGDQALTPLAGAKRPEFRVLEWRL